MTVSLKLHWDPQREDNFTTATAEGERDASAVGYTPIRVEGYVYADQQSNTVPLKQYWNPVRGDNYTTATVDGERSAIEAGYQFIRVEGYVYPNQQPGTVPLKLYYNPQREDNYTTATSDGEQSAIAAGYQFIRVEGYVYASLEPTSISIDTGDMDMGAGHFMGTRAVLYENGHIDAVTHTMSVTWLGGFKGGVYILLEDANGNIIGSTSNQHVFGVDGRWIGRSDRVDYWAEDIDPDLARRTRKLRVYHTWADNILDNLRRAAQLIQEAVAAVKPAAELVGVLKGIGGVVA